MKYITDVEEIRLLAHKEPFTFTCIKCGNPCTLKRQVSKNNQINDFLKYGGLVCSKCKFQMSYPREQASKAHKDYYASLSPEERYEASHHFTVWYNNLSPEEKKEVDFKRAEAQRNMSPEKKQLKLEHFRETNRKLFGTDGRPKCSIGSDEFKQRMLEIHGVEHVSEIPGIAKRIVEGAAKNAGYDGDLDGINSIAQLPFVKEKIENTNLERIGVKYPFQSDIFQEKGCQTRETEYGDRYFNNREKADETFRKNHNGMSFAEYGGSEECQELIKASKLEHYGDENYNNPEKSMETCMERFDNPTYFGSEAHKNQTTKRCLEKFGNETYYGSEVFKQYMLDTYGTLCPSFKYNYYGIMFDSSWELAIWIYCIDHFIPIIRCPFTYKYTDMYDKEHTYYPDFMINGKLVEVKGDQFFREDGTMFCPYRYPDWTDEKYNYECDIVERKHQCGLQHGIEFWRESECASYIAYCDLWYPGWNKIYLLSNMDNPSYGGYAYVSKNNAVSPYDKSDEDGYVVLKKGVNPYDIGKK